MSYAPGTPQHCTKSANRYETHGVDWDKRITVTKRGGRRYLTGICNTCHTSVEAEEDIDRDWSATNITIEEEPW